MKIKYKGELEDDSLKGVTITPKYQKSILLENGTIIAIYISLRGYFVIRILNEKTGYKSRLVMYKNTFMHLLLLIGDFIKDKQGSNFEV